MLPPIAIEPLGLRHGGEELIAFTLHAAHGVQMRVLNLGGIVWSWTVPDAHGVLGDIVLGYDDPAAYLSDPFYLGAIVGRYANRIGHSRFTLDGTEHHVTANRAPHHLHGGHEGLHRVVWSVEPIETAGAQGLRMRHRSPHGTEGFPGTLDIVTTYWLHADASWTVEFHAESDRATPVNLTQHSYFNLGSSSQVFDHTVQVAGDVYLPVDEWLIPNAPLRGVTGSVLDLRAPRLLQDVARHASLGAGGLDHSFAVRGWEQSATPLLRDAAWLRHEASGRQLHVQTSEPAIHCYAGHFLEDVAARGGRRVGAYGAFCLEAQHFADSPNRADLPSTIVAPGRPLRAVTRFTPAALERPHVPRG